MPYRFQNYILVLIWAIESGLALGHAFFEVGNLLPGRTLLKVIRPIIPWVSWTQLFRMGLGPR